MDNREMYVRNLMRLKGKSKFQLGDQVNDMEEVDMTPGDIDSLPIMGNQSYLSQSNLPRTLRPTSLGDAKWTEDEFVRDMMSNPLAIKAGITEDDFREQYKGLDDANKRKEVDSSSYFPLYMMGDLDPRTKFYAAGRMAGNAANGENKGLNITGAAAGALSGLLGSARDFMSGFGASKANDRMMDYYYAEQQRRKYNPQRQYMNQNDRGGFSGKLGGQPKFEEGGEKRALTEAEKAYFLKLKELEVRENLAALKQEQQDLRRITTTDGTIDYTRGGDAFVPPQLTFQLGGEMPEEGMEQEMTDEDIAMAMAQEQAMMQEQAMLEEQAEMEGEGEPETNPVNQEHQFRLMELLSRLQDEGIDINNIDENQLISLLKESQGKGGKKKMRVKK